MIADIAGHQGPLQVLRRAVSSGRVPQAYLFLGPPNVGKTLVAMHLAKALNCLTHAAPATPEAVDCCDTCRSCQRFDSGQHPDFRLISPLSNLGADKKGDDEGEADADSSPLEIEGSLISTLQIVELVGGRTTAGGKEATYSGHAALKIAEARRRVYVITAAESMHDSAANRILKTLEEPPPDTTFILTSSNPSRLLPTIISRCQVVNFHPVPQAEAEAHLRARFPAVDPVVVRTVVALSGGRVGWAVRLLQHPQIMVLREELVTLCRELKNFEQVECLRLGEQILSVVERWWRATAPDEDVAEKALKQARDRVLRTRFPDVLDVLSSWFRDLVLVGADPQAPQLINQDHLADLQHLAPLYTPEACRRVCLHIEELKKQLRQNLNLRLAAEVLALRLLTA